MGEPRRSLLVVIDGPAGAGKSTVARRLAKRLGVPFLDTGAIYRTLALVARRRGIDWEDEAMLVDLAREFPISFGDLDVVSDEVQQAVRFEGEDVSDAIRTADISLGASVVSRHPQVRAALLGIQRALGAQGGVAEGRDMGTVVFPQAPYKFFLTADPVARARRRLEDLRRAAAPGQALPTLQEVATDIAERDMRDASRATAPLQQAPDALRVDTTELGPDEVVARLLDVIG